MKQQKLLNTYKNSYGGELLKTRRGRTQGRPLTTRSSMHLVLRSSKAKGAWSFTRFDNDYKIHEITERFAHKYGVKILSLANVGNHLHFHIKLSNRQTYKKFIRAITAAIMMAITGASRWNPVNVKFWDYRPFTRIVGSYYDFLRLTDYIEINRLEGIGIKRMAAKMIIAANTT